MKDDSLHESLLDKKTDVKTSNRIIQEISTSSYNVSRLIDNSKIKETIQIKSIILGNSSVGKTSILFRLYNNRFLKNDEISNNYEFNNINIQIKETKIEISFVDIPSKNTFDEFMGKNALSCELFILVYSIDDEESFNNLNYWKNEIKKYFNEKNPIILLLGNKLDNIEERKVSTNQAKKFSNDNDIDFFEEISAKNGDNIDKIFNECFIKIYKNYYKVKNKSNVLDVAFISNSEMAFEVSKSLNPNIISIKANNSCFRKLRNILIITDLFLLLILVLLIVKYGFLAFAYLFNII